MLNLTLFFKTIKAKRFQWLAFSVLGFILLLMYLPVFPSLQAQASNYDDIIKTLPKGVLSAFNVTESLPTLMGFLASKHFGFVWALMIVLLVGSFASFSLAKEVENKTLGFLLSQPISRLRLYWVRFFTGLFGLTIFILFSELATWPLAKLFNYSAPFSEVFYVGILGFVFGFAILSLGFLFSACFSEASKSTSFFSAVLLIMYIAHIASSLEPSLNSLRYISIFYYFNPGQVVFDNKLNISAILALLGTGLSSSLLGSIIFNKRDLNV